MVLTVAQKSEYTGEAYVLLGFKFDFVVGVELPLVDNDWFDSQRAVIEIVFLLGAHVKDACLVEHHLGFNLKIL